VKRSLPTPGRRRWLHLMVLLLGFVTVLVVMAAWWVLRVPPRLSAREAVARPASAHGPHHVAAATTDPDPGLRPLLATVASPLRVLEIGDSLGIDLGDQLRAQLDAAGSARTVVASVGDSGLSNLSYYDWPAHLATLLAADHPQLVVVFVGANDDQGLYVDGAAAAPGSPTWVAAYAGRVDDVVRESTSAGARVVWVGMPPMASPDLNAAVGLENGIYRRETAAHAGTLFLSATAVLGDASGRYEITGVDASGQVALRTSDGVHLTPAGAGLLARSVIASVDGRWHLSLGAPVGPRPNAPGSGDDPVHG